MEIIYNTVKTQTLWLQHQAANSLGTLLSIVPFGWTKFSVYQNASISTIKRNHAYHKWCPQLRRNTILTLIPHQIYLSSHCAKISAREKKTEPEGKWRHSTRSLQAWSECWSVMSWCIVAVLLMTNCTLKARCWETKPLFSLNPHSWNKAQTKLWCRCSQLSALSLKKMTISPTARYFVLWMWDEWYYSVVQYLRHPSFTVYLLLFFFLANYGS